MRLRDKATDKNVKAKPLKSTTSCDKTPVQFSGTQVQNSATHAKSEPFDMEHGTYKHIQTYKHDIESIIYYFKVKFYNNYRIVWGETHRQKFQLQHNIFNLALKLLALI